MKKPEIICTLGTTTDDKKVLEDMVEAGMSCARMNTAYATIEEYQDRLDLLRSVADIEVMMDIKGPQVRLEAEASYPIEEGDLVYAGFKDEPLHFSKNFYNDVDIGDTVLFENGTIETSIVKKKENKLVLDVINPGKEGILRKKMGVNVPGKYLRVPRLSDKDFKVIDFSVKNQIEYIALSFTRNYKDIVVLKRAIDHYKRKYNCNKDICIVAKIEDQYGINNLKDIIKQSKRNNITLRIMVGRGDLYVELPKGKLPYAQEYIIKTCKENDVFVITATGVLESMQYKDEPARAEIVDVYTAYMQKTDAFLLSGETSNGHAPALVVKTLAGLLDQFTIK